MTKYAAGKHAFGYCDRCGFRYPLGELKYEFSVGQKTGLRTCPECYDPDHPQNFLHEVDMEEGIALEDPRPDVGLEESRKLYSWNPVGVGNLEMSGQVGQARVVTT